MEIEIGVINWKIDLVSCIVTCVRYTGDNGDLTYHERYTLIIVCRVRKFTVVNTRVFRFKHKVRSRTEKRARHVVRENNIAVSFERHTTDTPSYTANMNNVADECIGGNLQPWPHVGACKHLLVDRHGFRVHVGRTMSRGAKL